MLYDLQIKDSVYQVQYRKLLYKKAYSLGRSIQNDFVILDLNVPLFWKRIEKIKHGYCVNELSNDLKHDDRFLVEIKYSRLFYCISIVFSAFLAYMLYSFTVFHSAQSEQKQEIFLPVQSAQGVLKDNDVFIDELNFYFNNNDFNRNSGAQLNFSSGNILESDILNVLVNEHYVSRVKSSERMWSKEQRVAIKKELIQSGKNIITFKLNRNKTSEKMWGVRNIYIETPQKKVEQHVDAQVFKEYFESFLKLPNPDENDFKKIHPFIERYKQSVLVSDNELQKSIRRKIMLIESKREHYFRTKNLSEHRYRQLSYSQQQLSQEFE